MGFNSGFKGLNTKFNLYLLSSYEDGLEGRRKEHLVVEVCSFLTLTGKKPSAAPSLIMDCSLAQNVTACVVTVEIRPRSET